MESTEIVNRVSQSSLKTFDLEDLYQPGDRVVWDMAPHLFQGLVLREREFRAIIAENDWKQYQGQNVAILCSTDAIVPTWAYMLVAISLQPFAENLVFGNLQDLESYLFQKRLMAVNLAEFKDAKVVVKGCSKVPVPVSAYVEITRLLKPIAASLMFGEPCSTVPLFKRPKNTES